VERKQADQIGKKKKKKIERIRKIIERNRTVDKKNGVMDQGESKKN
jgi:hypothetical protein